MEILVSVFLVTVPIFHIFQMYLQSETTEIHLIPYYDADVVPTNYIEYSVELTYIYFLVSKQACGFDYYMLEHVIQHQYMLLN